MRTAVSHGASVVGSQWPVASCKHARATNQPYSVLSTKYRVLSAAIPVLAALTGCGPLALAQSKAGAETSAGALEVVTAGKPLRKALTLTTTQPARIEALERTPIHSKLAAYVAEVLVDYGDQVKQGQPLVKLSAPEMDAELNQKRALLEQSRAEYAQALAGAKATEAAVATA